MKQMETDVNEKDEVEVESPTKSTDESAIATAPDGEQLNIETILAGTAPMDEPTDALATTEQESAIVGKKLKRPRWVGIASNMNDRERLTVMIVLLLTSITQTFVQLGFIGIGFDGEYVGYVLGTLVPVSLCSLLFGKARGMIFGLISGVILWAHAIFQPLDLYESYYVSLVGSCVLFAVAGLSTGIAFGRALRNNPPRIRKIIYLLIACLICSVIISVTFYCTVLFHIVFSVASSAVSGSLSLEPLQAIMGIGDPFILVLGDWLLLFITVLAACFVKKQYEQYLAYPKMRTTFRQWLLIVVFSAFMLISAISFVATTETAKSDANEQMTSQLTYLSEQLNDRITDSRKLAASITIDLPESVVSALQDATAVEKLLEGYSVPYQGTVIIYKDGQAIASNSDAYPVGSSMADNFGFTAGDDFDGLAETNTVRQAILNGISISTALADDPVAPPELNISDVPSRNTELAFMRVGKSGDYHIVILVPTRLVFSGRARTMLWMSISSFLLLAAVYWLTERLLVVVVERPIKDTNEVLASITDGNLDTEANARDTVEFATLSDGINATVDSLKNLIDEADRRMEHDLATAREIQEGALPCTFPPFPELEAFDLYASMNAAREVGGDFYDFFLIDDQTVGFLIADVSGKGIPGSLFMMAAKRELKNAMEGGLSLPDAVSLANAHLCAGNSADMFVTVWAATLNWETGELTYVNAGHNPPLLRHGMNGPWEWLEKRGGLFLGTFETAKYRSSTLTLQKDDEILLYTDGVNEAFSVNDEEYGNDRLEAFVNSHGGLHPRELIQALRADVAHWAEGAEQSDDITMLSLEFGVKPEIYGSITIDATLDNLDQVIDLVDVELDQRMCPLGIRRKVEVALEELYVNVCRYAYADQDTPGMVTISYMYTPDPAAITVELRDHGVPFNPLTREDPTKPSNIQEAKIGGLGIFMVKKSMDDFSYVYDDNTNIVVFRKSW